MDGLRLTPGHVMEYAAWLRGAEKSPATIEKYARYASVFVCFADARPLTKELAITFKDCVAARYTAAGANGIIAAVNGFLFFLGKADMRMKPLKVQRRHFISREKELSRAEFEKLLSEAERRHKLMSDRVGCTLHLLSSA